ncbi:unnamed protein product [Alternaria alternata]
MISLGRSRARRKEYMHELEAKLRSYEQIGIEASSEIQTAARRVLHENQKLRSLLHGRGVSESEILSALEDMSDRRYEHDTAASRLHAMLERRVNTNVVSSTSSPIPSYTRAASIPRQKPPVPPVTIPPTRPTALSYNDSPSPGSMVSTMSTPPPASYPATLYTTPMTPSAAQIKSEHVQYDYPYDQPYSNAWAYSSDGNYTAEPGVTHLIVIAMSTTQQFSAPWIDIPNTTRQYEEKRGQLLDISVKLIGNQSAGPQQPYQK